MYKQAESDEECKAIYASLDTELIAPALMMLAEELSDVRDEIIASAKADPEDWSTAYHMVWGMGIRNMLRDKGYGEEYFGVENLDDIYVPLVEDALHIRESL